MNKINKVSFNKYFNRAFKEITGFDDNEVKVINEIFWKFITEHIRDRAYINNHAIKEKFLCKDWNWKWYDKWEERFVKDGYNMPVRNHKKSKQDNMFWALIDYIFENVERDSEAKELKIKFKVNIENISDDYFGKKYIIEILNKNPNALPPFFPFDDTIASPVFDDINTKTTNNNNKKLKNISYSKTKKVSKWKIALIILIIAMIGNFCNNIKTNNNYIDNKTDNSSIH